MIPNQKASDLIAIKFDEQNNKLLLEFPNEVTSPSFKFVDYLSELDSFFYGLRSCIDSFLWEIILIFNLECLRINFFMIKETMNDEHENHEITQLLNGLGDEPWFKYINYLRNFLVHRGLTELGTSRDLKIYLPINSETGSYSIEREFEVLPRLKSLLVATRDFLERGYKILINEFDHS